MPVTAKIGGIFQVHGFAGQIIKLYYVVVFIQKENVKWCEEITMVIVISLE